MISQYINVCTVDMAESLKNIGDFCYYIVHPSKILWNLWNWSVELSFILCLTICMASTIRYIFDFKKFAKWCPGSVLIYTVIQSINSMLR